MFNRNEERYLESIADSLKKIARDLEPKVLSSLAIQFYIGGSMSTAAVTLIVGQSTVATVTGTDQFGNPFTPLPAISWSIDQPTLDSITADATPPAEDVTSLAVGTANLTASATNAASATVSVTGVITNVPVPPPTPVLTTLTMSLSTPA